MPYHYEGFAGFGFIFWIIIIVLAIVLITKLINTPQNNNNKTGETALDILKKRYARGEITKEQYLAMKKDLE